jgi:hypothetical protein
MAHRFISRVRTLERRRRDERQPAVVEGTEEYWRNVAHYWRDAMRFVRHRCLEDDGCGPGDMFALTCRGIAGKPEWVAIAEAMAYIAPIHPIQRDTAPLSDAAYLRLLIDWLKYKNANGPWLPEFAKGFPDSTTWSKYWPEISEAWRQGHSPNVWRARRPPDVPAVATNGEPTTAG